MKQNPYNIIRKQGVPGARTIALPANYAFELTMDTWWSAVLRAGTWSDFTGLDALYSYTLKSSTIVRAAIEKRLAPLKARSFGVYFGEVEDERLTKLLKDSKMISELVYQRGLANFVYAKVVGVDKNGDLFFYPLRNLDVVNRAIKEETYDVEGKWIVANHVNLFWMQTSDTSEDKLGLLEPITRDYINSVNSQNNWQTASQFQAYQQLMLYYENGDEKMEIKAEEIARQIGQGTVITSGKDTDEVSGKVLKEFELENAAGANQADMFRIFKENIDHLNAQINQLVLGSSLLGMSDKNTNSEQLIRAHLKMFRNICESDVRDVEHWFNDPENLTKLAFILKEPKLANAQIKVRPSDFIDTGDIEIYVGMLKDLGLYATEKFVEKTGLEATDVIGYEQLEQIEKRRAVPEPVPTKEGSTGNVASVVIERAKRVFGGAKP